ncbi:MAG: lipid-A-disaccharide synthase [Halofilum sp. (in: g-proteobacteria)]|nr:lipid-A-disaccharide synthase [Halofilum sp. (in: g-proteobacteria)]
MGEGPRLMISAGEASGDHHAARFVQALRQRGHAPVLAGMGGPRLAREGMELVVDCRELAIIGIVEVLVHWRRIMRELERLRARLRAAPPDLLILVDYPEFNLKLAATARELGVPVLFYVSPQVWAWRPHRVARIGRLVDMMAVLFPFEVDFYERAGVPVRYVGHPLVDEIHPEMPAADVRAELGLDRERPTLGLMPGSRRGEIERLLPLLLESARSVERERGPVNLVLPLAATLDPEPVQARIEQSGLEVRLVPGGRAYDVIPVCDAIVTASGTATLEVALLGVPMAVVYRVHWLTWQIMHRLMTVDDIALVNIVAGRRIVQEFVQRHARPEAIAREAARLLDDADYRARMQAELAEVRTRMGEGDGPDRMAALIEEMLAGGKAVQGNRE